MAVSFASLGLCDAPHLCAPVRTEGEVAGIALDARAIQPEFLFVAIKGARTHGIRHVDEAIARGACAVLTCARGAAFLAGRIAEFPCPLFVHPHPRIAAAELSAAFFGAQPDHVVAITGTNGKSSVASFTAQLWRQLGHEAGVIGTLGAFAHGMEEPLALTTPDAPHLHAILARMHQQGTRHVALEASSHGLHQARLDGVRLSAGAFLNMSRDHLDYHADEAAYLAAKARLIDRLLPAGAPFCLNADIPEYAYLHALCRMRKCEPAPFGTSERAEGGWRLTARVDRPGGQLLEIRVAGRSYRVGLPLIGTFQAMNALAAAALVATFEPRTAQIVRAMEELHAPRGRMELVARRTNGAFIYVDYAHTPAALEAALQAARGRIEAGGRLSVLFGAGGERDKGKRKRMGAVAAAGADRLIVTDDNPRTESPEAIRAEIMAGAGRAPVLEISGRREAIATAIGALAEGDTLLIAGKGHERGQIVGETLLPFDDAEEVCAALRALDGAEAQCFARENADR